MESEANLWYCFGFFNCNLKGVNGKLLLLKVSAHCKCSSWAFAQKLNMFVEHALTSNRCSTLVNFKIIYAGKLTSI